MAASSCVLACSLNLPSETAASGEGGTSSGSGGSGGGGVGGVGGVGGEAGAGGIQEWCAGIVPTPLLCADFNAGSLQNPFGSASSNFGSFDPDITHYTSRPRSVRFSGMEGAAPNFREAIYASYGHLHFELDVRVDTAGGASRVYVAALELDVAVVSVFVEGETLGIRENPPGQEWTLTMTLAPQAWHRVVADFDTDTATGEASVSGGSPVSTPLSLTGMQAVDNFWVGFTSDLPAGSWAVQIDNVLFDAY